MSDEKMTPRDQALAIAQIPKHHRSLKREGVRFYMPPPNIFHDVGHLPPSWPIYTVRMRDGRLEWCGPVGGFEPLEVKG